MNFKKADFYFFCGGTYKLAYKIYLLVNAATTTWTPFRIEKNTYFFTFL